MPRQNSYASEERLRKAVQQAAQVVSIFGHDFMPLLDRVSHEYRTEKDRRAIVSEALSMIEPPTIDLKPISKTAA